MNYKSVILSGALSVSMMAIASGWLMPVLAQAEPQNVSVVHLQVQKGSNGEELVVTPKGMLVPLPGKGVDGDVVEIYIGANGGCWYVDRVGQTEDLTGYVAQLRARSGQLQQTTPPQYMPYSGSTGGNTSTSSSSSSGGGGSAAGTAAVAGMGAMAGAMAGAAMSGAYYNNVPYGTPVYYGANGHPYYNDGGKGVFVQDGNINYNNVYAANSIQKSNQQQQLQQAAAYQNQNQQERQANTSANQAQRQAAYAPQQPPQTAPSHQRYQQQQQWYQSQGQSKAWQGQASGDNPFVRQGGADGGRFGAAQQASGDGGRFGAAQQAGGDGGRFGGGAQAGGEGGRFGGGAQAGGEGGRFGGGAQAGGEGGRFGGGAQAGGEGGRFGGGAQA
ncbi:MAG: hypothetical protein K2W95_18585, partial [Candidatus Obscuribacterales bacterium]|nr:hypothetical protein [Candidatus Obscuribacterales bacterium]